ncbi:aldo/keto reductase (plasmid) [Streptomyces alboflavus]|uniref:Aldo/keto reductase n=1 Tax=Streptomyces alboflavus TaxID=67267 RepID=A0A291W3G0_9ACTN|nr:aldo/keto reductase [Streptomyces alboflavus]ATM24830.1 aldo/keto reductase [Streptomyces alboflavus]
MTLTPPAGTITIAGKPVSRLGFGTMRLTGPGIWGNPADRDTAKAVLQQAVHTHGITHIDTADSYGPHTVEHLIHEALHPYPQELLIATKVGFLRPGPGQFVAHGHPQHLRSSVEGSLRRLGVERLGLCYLHRIDPKFSLEDQITALQTLQREGKIEHIGLSKVSVDEIARVSKELGIAAVQNALSMTDTPDPALGLCRDLNIPYVPYRPLGAGSLAQEHGVRTPLRWLLAQGPHIAPIPSTSQPQHLEQIVSAAAGDA